MNNLYISENTDILKNFLDTCFFNNWKKSPSSETKDALLPNFSGFELNLDYRCQLSCSYCYVNKYGKSLFQNKNIDFLKILNNIEKAFECVVSNNLAIPDVEIFSGSPFDLGYIWDIFDIFLDKFSKLDINRRPSISVPTPLNFVLNSDITKKVIDYYKLFEKNNIKFNLSSSFDGPFLDNISRPFRDKDKKYTESFYKSLFLFRKEIPFGLHPMISADSVRYWKDNFLWFDEYFKVVENGNLYLLEVRNSNWSSQNCLEFENFLTFLIHYIYSKNKKENKRFPIDFNILSSPFSSIGRGLGCSLQSTLSWQPSTNAISPCHRLSYDLFVGGYLFFENNSYSVVSKNVPLYMSTFSVNHEMMTPCFSCPINKLCSGGCLGSNYESTGDPFTVSPSVCRMEHSKIKTIIKTFSDIGILDDYINSDDPIRKSQILYLLRSNV